MNPILSVDTFSFRILNFNNDIKKKIFKRIKNSKDEKYLFINKSNGNINCNDLLQLYARDIINKNKTAVLIDLSRKNNKNKCHILITVHVNNFIDISFNNKDSISSETVIKEILKICSEILNVKTIDSDRVIIQRIDLAVDMQMNHMAESYLRILRYKHLSKHYTYYTDVNHTVTAHPAREFKKIYSNSINKCANNSFQTEYLSRICIYNKGKKYNFDESIYKLIRFEMRCYRNDTTNKVNPQRNPCKQMKNLNEIFTYDYTNWFNHKISKGYLPLHELDTKYIKKSLKNSRIKEDFAALLVDNEKDYKTLLSSYLYSTLIHEVYDHIYGFDLYNEFVSKLCGCSLILNGQLLNINKVHSDNYKLLKAESQTTHFFVPPETAHKNDLYITNVFEQLKTMNWKHQYIPLLSPLNTQDLVSHCLTS